MIFRILTYLFVFLSLSLPLQAADDPFVIEVDDVVQVMSGQPAYVQALIRFPEKHYLFAEKTTLSLQGEGLKLLQLDHPQAQMKKDKFFKKTLPVYMAPVGKDTHEVTFRQHFQMPSTLRGPKEIKAILSYQGCSPTVCYLPRKHVWMVTLTPTATPISDQTSTLTNKPFWLAIIFVFLMGLLSLLTPCVFPMIPITLSVLGVHESSRMVAFVRGLAFALGLALMYAALGVAAALTGGILGNALQSVWVVAFVSLFVFIMGISLLGWFEINVSKLASRFSKWTDTAPRSLVPFFLGMTTGIVAAPCIGPIVLSILALVAKQGAPIKGFVLLFSYALGLGLPFVLLSVFSTYLYKLPKSGMWMDHFKKFLGIILIFVAIFLAKPLLSVVVYYAAAAFAALIVAFVIRFKLLFGKRVSAFSFAMMLMISFGLFYGAVLPRLTGFPTSDGIHQSEKLMWLSDYDEALKVSSSNHKPILVDFYADWCVACKEIERVTFGNDRVQHEMEEWVLLRIDLTHSDEKENALVQKYEVFGLPVLLLLDEKGEVLPNGRFDGFVGPKKFYASMMLAKKEFHND